MKDYKPSPETMWKKGNVPHTAAPVGHEIRHERWLHRVQV